jgi:hypothetical protein
MDTINNFCRPVSENLERRASPSNAEQRQTTLSTKSIFRFSALLGAAEN